MGMAPTHKIIQWQFMLNDQKLVGECLIADDGKVTPSVPPLELIELFSYSLVMRYKRSSVDMEDLKQDAVLILLEFWKRPSTWMKERPVHYIWFYSRLFIKEKIKHHIQYNDRKENIDADKLYALEYDDEFEDKLLARALSLRGCTNKQIAEFMLEKLGGLCSSDDLRILEGFVGRPLNRETLRYWMRSLTGRHYVMSPRIEKYKHLIEDMTLTRAQVQNIVKEKYGDTIGIRTITRYRKATSDAKARQGSRKSC